MTSLVTAMLFCLAAGHFFTPVALAQEGTPAADLSVPEGAVANDSRVFFKGGLENVEVVQFILMTNWEMDSEDAADRFLEDLRESVSADLTVRDTDAALENLNDDQVLIVGDDQTGGPVTVILFRQDNIVGTWMAVGDAGQDRTLADLYNGFFGDGFDPATPFPAAADLPEGYAPVGDVEGTPATP